MFCITLKKIVPPVSQSEKPTSFNVFVKSLIRSIFLFSYISTHCVCRNYTNLSPHNIATWNFRISDIQASIQRSRKKEEPDERSVTKGKS